MLCASKIFVEIQNCVREKKEKNVYNRLITERATFRIYRVAFKQFS